MRTDRKIAMRRTIDYLSMLLQAHPTGSESIDRAARECRESRCLYGKKFLNQCKSILRSIHHWRHPDAAFIRKSLRLFIAEEERGRQ